MKMETVLLLPPMEKASGAAMVSVDRTTYCSAIFSRSFSTFRLTLDCWNWLSSSLLDIMSLDLAYIKSHVPIMLQEYDDLGGHIQHKFAELRAGHQQERENCASTEQHLRVFRTASEPLSRTSPRISPALRRSHRSAGTAGRRRQIALLPNSIFGSSASKPRPAAIPFIAWNTRFPSSSAPIAVLGAKLSNNQHKVDQAWDWLKRIWICWGIINGIGAFIAYITPQP